MYDVIILGAGASGLMCAANISKKLKVAIIEHNTQAAKKLKISGGGKCNITNVSVGVENYLGNEELLKSTFKKFSQKRFLDFLERNRVELEVRKGRYYFCKESSQVVIDLLLRNVKRADLILGEEIVEVLKNDAVFEVISEKKRYKARNVVVASGGESFKNIGASDIGLKIAQKFGIEYKKFEPALVGLTLQKEQFWMKELSGLSCYVKISVCDRTLNEEMLFAHKGISGPAVLSASLYWKKGEIAIDFLPDQAIKGFVKNGGKRLFSSVIPLPKRLSKSLLHAIGLKDKECSKATKEDLLLLEKIHNYRFAPAGNFGFSKAEVSRGGVLADELNFQTLESKKEKGLYFIGEVVDITGELGGYNFQWAFSSAYVCAKSLK